MDPRTSGRCPCITWQTIIIITLVFRMPRGNRFLLSSDIDFRCWLFKHSSFKAVGVLHRKGTHCTTHSIELSSHGNHMYQFYPSSFFLQVVGVFEWVIVAGMVLGIVILDLGNIQSSIRYLRRNIKWQWMKRRRAERAQRNIKLKILELRRWNL